MPLLLVHIHTLLLMLLECGSELDALLLSHLEVKHGLILNFGVVLLLERNPMLLLHWELLADDLLLQELLVGLLVMQWWQVLVLFLWSRLYRIDHVLLVSVRWNYYFLTIFFHLRWDDQLDAIIWVLILRIASNINRGFLFRFINLNVMCCGYLISFLATRLLPHIRGLEVYKAAFGRDENFNRLSGSVRVICLVSIFISYLLNFEVLGFLDIIILGEFWYFLLAHLISVSPFLCVINRKQRLLSINLTRLATLASVKSLLLSVNDPNKGVTDGHLHMGN